MVAQFQELTKATDMTNLFGVKNNSILYWIHFVCLNDMEPATTKLQLKPFLRVLNLLLFV